MKNINKKLKLKLDTELIKWLNKKKRNKIIIKLKKQNEIKLEDIIYNIYNFLLKVSSHNYQFCFC